MEEATRRLIEEQLDCRPCPDFNTSARERLVGLTAESLSEEIEFMGTKRLEWVVMWMISKIIHHE